MQDDELVDGSTSNYKQAFLAEGDFGSPLFFAWDIDTLLYALNNTKSEVLGRRAHPFTAKELVYFASPKRNALHYRSFTIPKKSGGYREIRAPKGLLKSLLKTTSDLLSKHYTPLECVTGFVPGKSVVDNARPHVGKRYVFNADLKDFFPSITRQMVKRSLRAAPFRFSAEAASIISGLCCTCVPEPAYAASGDALPSSGCRTFLPQGSPTSPVLSNIVCRSLDRRLQGLARRFAVTYTRYADDITFSADHHVFRETDDFMKQFRRIVASTGFTLNEKKLRLQKRGGRQEVTGLLVTETVNVTKAFIRDLSCILYIWKRYGANAAYARFLRKNLRGRTCKEEHHSGHPFKAHMLATVRGRLSYLKMVKGMESHVWQKLWDLYFPLFTQYVLRPVGGTMCQYYHSWTIERFEQLTGARLISETDVNGREEWFITKNGFRQRIRFSRYCQTRMKSILWDYMSQDWLEFKREFRIGLTAYRFLEDYPVSEESTEGLCKTDRQARWNSFRPLIVGWMVFRKEPSGGQVRVRPRHFYRTRGGLPPALLQLRQHPYF